MCDWAAFCFRGKGTSSKEPDSAAHAAWSKRATYPVTRRLVPSVELLDVEISQAALKMKAA